jgi:hypothetical protein
VSMRERMQESGRSSGSVQGGGLHRGGRQIKGTIEKEREREDEGAEETSCKRCWSV